MRSLHIGGRQGGLGRRGLAGPVRLLGSMRLAGLILCLSFLPGCPEEPPGTSEGWEPAFDATDAGWLLSAWGSSGSALYVVGGSRAPDGGKARFFDGAGWSEVGFGQPVPLLNWVYGFGPEDVWIAADEGKVLHRSAGGWEVMVTPTTENLWGTWGAAPDDLWAVGGLEAEPVALRWDGEGWTEVTAPGGAEWSEWLLAGDRVSAFFKVWGTSSDNVYIVGDAGTLLRWDGDRLTQIDSGTVRDLISLWGTGPDRIAAVGGRGNGVIVTYDGTEWRSRELAPLPGLNGVWMGDDDVVHAVGEECTLVTLDFESGEVTDDSCDDRLTVHAVFGDDERMLTAVGGNLALFDGFYRGLALRRARGADE